MFYLDNEYAQYSALHGTWDTGLQCAPGIPISYLCPISDFVVYSNQPPYHAYSVRADNLQMKPAFTRIKEVKVNALTILNPNYLSEFCNYIGEVVIEFGCVHQPAF